MEVTNRKRQILALLLNRKEEITIGEIAGEIQVSVRTVHRELDEMEAWLAASGLQLSKKAGRGVQLHGSAEQMQALHERLDATPTREYSAEERKINILCILLESSEPLKIYALAQSLYVTMATIGNDLDELEGWVAGQGLTLIRRRGYGVEIAGAEAVRRSAICRLVEERLDESDLFGKASEQAPDPTSRRLAALAGKQQLLAVEQALWSASCDWLEGLPEAEYTQLLIRLAVAVTRLRDGNALDGAEAAAFAAAGEPSASVEALTAHLARELRLALPPAEAAYMAHCLQSKEQLRHSGLDAGELQMQEPAAELIARVERRIGLSLGGDASLREGLASHLARSWRKLVRGQAIRNPLLAQIKRDFETLFQVVREEGSGLLPGPAVPDEEIGFIVMHFGAAVERLKRFRRPVRAVLVCTSGIGSSKLLAIRVQQELPQIYILGHTSWYEASRLPEHEYDVILSTIDLPIEPDKYFKLSPLLAGEEVDKLRAFIQEITLRGDAPDSAAAAKTNLQLNRLKKQKTYLDASLNLIEGFRVYAVPRGPLSELLRHMVGVAAREGCVGDEETLVRQLLERERHGSQRIPDTRLALFHTRSAEVRSLYFSLFRLESTVGGPLEAPSEGLAADAEGGEGAQPAASQSDTDALDQALLLLAPWELPKATLEIVSEMSGLLLEPSLLGLLADGTEVEIRRYYTQALAAFIENQKEMESTVLWEF
ncbi:BglG family transcription antiterminator [Paenibacillus athensensis]|uniref:Uncharacterized protein n=1 Tax=Paenibacillus athensensis TaxID=1967502 RepID=A0A4Y8Q771_9BACL|nr:BglG family transcription antiterminator [Paenibacillus athensensis]MCD1257359.1 BglG family transcription antiterminator [Paenibacillus athensensis]